MASRYLSLDQDELMSSLLNSGLGPVTIQGLDLYIQVVVLKYSFVTETK